MLPAYLESGTKSREVLAPRKAFQRAFTPIHRPPLALLDKQKNYQLHVNRLLQKCRHQGRCWYLVKWRGCLESYSPIKFKIMLRQDCPHDVGVFESLIIIVLQTMMLPTNNDGIKRVYVFTPT